MSILVIKYIDIWHCRLGHLSNEIMLAMKQYYPILNSVREIICDACHKAKQKKLIFPVSSSHSLSLLNLKLNGFGVTASKLLDMVPKYVSPTELTIYVNFNFNTPHCIDPLIFSIQPHLHLS